MEKIVTPRWLFRSTSALIGVGVGSTMIYKGHNAATKEQLSGGAT